MRLIPRRNRHKKIVLIDDEAAQGIGPGTLRTYELLRALGRPDVMPGIALEDKKDNLQQQYQEACNAEMQGDFIAWMTQQLDAASGY